MTYPAIIPDENDRRNAFEQLFARYRRLLHFVAYRLLGDDDESEAATRATRTKAFADLPRFAHEGQFRSWIFRILIDEALRLRDAKSASISSHADERPDISNMPPAA